MQTVEAPLRVLADLESLLLILGGVEEVSDDLVVDLQHAELHLELDLIAGLLLVLHSSEQLLGEERHDPCARIESFCYEVANPTYFRVF